MLVLAVSAILLGMAWSASGRARSAYAVRSARVSFASLSARARATAIDRGHTVILEVSEAGDSAWISDGNELIEVLHFATMGGVEVSPSLRQCLGSRGLAIEGCGTVTLATDVVFTRQGRWAAGTLLPLGQFIEAGQGP